MTDAPTLAVLPSLPLDERRDLPDTAAIYFVLVGDTVLYIGQQCWRQSRMLSILRVKLIAKGAEV